MSLCRDPVKWVWYVCMSRPEAEVYIIIMGPQPIPLAIILHSGLYRAAQLDKSGIMGSQGWSCECSGRQMIKSRSLDTSSGRVNLIKHLIISTDAFLFW
jgi:hypothetical protein